MAGAGHDHDGVKRYLATEITKEQFTTAEAGVPGLFVGPYYEIHTDDGVDFFEVTFDITYSTEDAAKVLGEGDKYNIAW
jgi:hypothetical protein